MEHSQSIKELATALARAQGQTQEATKESTNESFNSSYADLNSVWNACRKALSDNGLSLTQAPEKEGLVTILMHSSGEFIKTFITYPDNKDEIQTPVQQLGSTITYLRRYVLASMVGIASKDDNDGQLVTTNNKIPMPKKVDRSNVIEMGREVANAKN